MDEATGFEAHVGDTPVAASVADQARSAAGGDDGEAYETLHRALQELGIEPAAGEPGDDVE